MSYNVTSVSVNKTPTVVVEQQFVASPAFFRQTSRYKKRHCNITLIYKKGSYLFFFYPKKKGGGATYLEDLRSALKGPPPLCATLCITRVHM